MCCLVLAGAVGAESPTLFGAALGVLVASKAYGVTKSSAVPRVLPRAITLVKANSRLGLTGTAAAAASAPIAVALSQIGSAWVLRYAFCLFVAATVLAVLLPARVDSPPARSRSAVRGSAAPARPGAPWYPRWSSAGCVATPGCDSCPASW